MRNMQGHDLWNLNMRTTYYMQDVLEESGVRRENRDFWRTLFDVKNTIKDKIEGGVT